MQIVQKKHRWFSKTFAGWFEVFGVQLSAEEKEIFYNESPEQKQLVEKFKEMALKKIEEPPIKVFVSFQKNHNPEKELIIASINEQGYGTIYEKKENDYTRTSFYGKEI